MSVRTSRLADVRRLLKQAAELELSAGAVLRLKWFLYALEHDDNVSLACRHFGIARTTYMRWWKRFDPQDASSLEEVSRRPHTVRAPETDERTVALIRELRLANPAMGKVGIQALLKQLHGVEASVSTVGRVISRNKLFFAPTASHAQKRGDAMPHGDVVHADAVTGAADDDASAFALPPLPTS
jgi:transposase-like protein